MKYTPGGIVAELLKLGEEATHAHVRKANEIRQRANLNANPRPDGRHVSAWYQPEFKDSQAWPMFERAPPAYYDGRSDAKLIGVTFAQCVNAKRGLRGWDLRAYRRGWATERAQR